MIENMNKKEKKRRKNDNNGQRTLIDKQMDLFCYRVAFLTVKYAANAFSLESRKNIDFVLGGKISKKNRQTLELHYLNSIIMCVCVCSAGVTVYLSVWKKKSYTHLFYGAADGKIAKIKIAIISATEWIAYGSVWILFRFKINFYSNSRSFGTMNTSLSCLYNCFGILQMGQLVLCFLLAS